MQRAADLLCCIALLGCGSDDSGQSPPSPTGPTAIVDADRSTHFFDQPFPSDDRLSASGHPDLAGYPQALTPLGDALISGWAARLEQTAVGFANNGAAYFRFDGPLSLPTETSGETNDPVLLIDLETGDRLPLLVRFVEDAAGDPFYADNTLAFGPALGSPPRSGATLAAVVMESSGARSPAGYRLPDGVAAGLARAGVDGTPAVATVFTVQDVTAQLRSLAEDAAARVDGLDWAGVRFRRVASLTYQQTQTPSGNDATAQIITYDDGETATTYLAPELDELDKDPSLTVEDLDHTVVFDASHPMAVFEAQVPLLNYSGLDDRPYMSPGIGHINDVDRWTGWIDFDREGLLSVPDVESVRVTLSLPRAPDGSVADNIPLIVWDHGTGGSAYNVLHRRLPMDPGRVLTEPFAEAGWGVLSRDSPLYGSRYPLLDEGYGASLGFYNIVNLPAFRDNQRQAALEGEQLRLFLSEALPDLLPEGSIDPTRVRRAGHSLGSVTTNLGVAMNPDAYEDAFLSGSGGLFSHYALDTGLLESIGEDLIESLFPLLGAPVPAELTVPNILGAALGLPEPAWGHLDRLHPAMQLFQWTMDPSDPMAVARDETLPIQMIIGRGDYQVPDFTSDALIEALPNARSQDCEARAVYDPHVCMYREPEGEAIVRDWVFD